MLEPDVPSNEKDRIETLQSLSILDTDPEERFDRITRLARRLFKVPIALVSLVDVNRQWFKSCVGLDATETGRDISFCGHAILDNKIFYIQDASKDPRFSDNPLVTGPPNIRFYAGRPISAPNGDKLGTLCIIDSEPRVMTEEEFETLNELAQTVEQELVPLHPETIDEVTNISNRTGFSQLAAHCLAMANRQKVSMSMAYFELNRFDPVDDGFKVKLTLSDGDKALKIFAKQMKETFRSSDLISHFNENKFVALFYNTDKDKTFSLVSRFSTELKRTTSTLGLDYDIGFSLGIVEYDQNSELSVDSLIEKARQEMNRSDSSNTSIA